jgi:GH25 family lysozyme M1 (1,4-beta-N-acetylmuramidase)
MPQQFAAQLQVFMDKLRVVAPCPPVLYVTQDFYSAYVSGQFHGIRLWVRDI